jgi:hypothetical protein
MSQKGEPDRMENDEPHFSRVRGDNIAYAGRQGSLRQRAVFQFGDCLNVAGSRRGRLHSSMLCRDCRAGKPPSGDGDHRHSSFPVISAFVPSRRPPQLAGAPLYRSNTLSKRKGLKMARGATTFMVPPEALTRLYRPMIVPTPWVSISARKPGAWGRMTCPDHG